MSLRKLIINKSLAKEDKIMSGPKKIGLITCIAVVAGNMMGSGIALLPASLAKIGSVAIWAMDYCGNWCIISGICFCSSGN